ncbi:MAG TPA: hypothetical protein VOA78_02740 [Candidatus Dormibacteraeota bacterium]|nr:hypothetical protein [Candidatus Dormibacteraeota bacterium]
MNQKKQLALLAGLLLVAGSVWYLVYFRTAKSSADPNVASVRSYHLLGIDNPELHWPELKAARTTEYKSNGRNPFSPEAPPPPDLTAKNEKPRHPAYGPPQKEVVPPLPPPTLPATLKFFGYGTVPNGSARRAFFSDGDDVFIVAEGETLLGRYRIIKVNNTNLEFEEIATGRHNTAPLVEDQAAAGQPST